MIELTLNKLRLWHVSQIAKRHPIENLSPPKYHSYANVYDHFLLALSPVILRNFKSDALIHFVNWFIISLPVQKQQ